MTKKLSNQTNFDMPENGLDDIQNIGDNMNSFSSNAGSSNEFSFTFKSLEVKNNNNITSKINRKKKLFLNHLTLLENEIASINNNKEFKRQKFVDDILVTYDNLFVQCDLHLNKLKTYNNKINLNYNKKKPLEGSYDLSSSNSNSVPSGLPASNFEFPIPTLNNVPTTASAVAAAAAAASLPSGKY